MEYNYLQYNIERRYIYIYIYIYIWFRVGDTGYVVFLFKSLPQRPISSKKDDQAADEFQKMGCSNVYSRQRGRQTIQAFLPLCYTQK